MREFNAANRWVKRAVVCLPQKYGMARATGYTVRVGVQDDGSVLVQQSGCEIGQGLNVKVAQVRWLCVCVASQDPLLWRSLAGKTWQVTVRAYSVCECNAPVNLHNVRFSDGLVGRSSAFDLRESCVRVPTWVAVASGNAVSTAKLDWRPIFD